MISRAVTPRQRGRRPLTAFAVLAVVAGTLFVSGSVLAAPYTGGVQDTGKFELDANTLDTDCTLPTDWAALYTAGGTKPCGSDGFAFVGDGVGNADKTYWSQGGSKDAYDPALGPWLYKGNDVSPDKNDIVNAFSAAYHITSGTDTTRFLFFGADRFNTSGDAQMGFQFLQADTCLAAIGGVAAGGTAGCPATTPNQAANAGKFVDPTTGAPVHHTNGDVLALVNFNNGGVLGLAGVFVWGGADGAGAGAYAQVIFGDGANCLTIGDPNNFCSTANTGNLTNEPIWPYTAKNQKGNVVTTYTPSAFIEGGINLSAIPNSGSCFPSFLAETRSSAGPSTGLGLTAQLKDLAFGKFELCGSTLATTAKDGSGGTIPAGGLSIGTGSVSVKDSAQLDVSGITTWNGTLDFYLCGPAATTCDATGTHIGSQVAVNQGTTMPVLSDAASVTSAGTYCWAGIFDSLTTGVPDRSDASASECFTVNPVTPTLDTSAPESSVNFGQPVRDNAQLSGTSNKPGTPVINPTTAGGAATGTITFFLYGPGSCTTLATGFPAAGLTASVTAGDGTYGPVSFTPQAPGVYHWKATYGGDSPNTNASVEHNTLCDDTDEDVTVNQVQTTISTRQFVYPQDIARIAATGGGNLAGNVEFKLYNSAANCTANGATGLVYSEAGSLHVISGASPQLTTTNNTTFKIIDGTTYVWRVTYTSTNSAQLGSSSACVESTTVTYVGNDTTNISIP